MRRLTLVLICALAVLAAGSAAPSAEAKPCSAGYVHAALPWGHKCLRVGQSCKVSGDPSYHRHGFHCHTGGRLGRNATKNASGSGCMSGYSPCLPKTADLNCADIPASKKPVRVTGDDPYRLDGDGDGWGCD